MLTGSTNCIECDYIWSWFRSPSSKLNATLMMACCHNKVLFHSHHRFPARYQTQDTRHPGIRAAIKTRNKSNKLHNKAIKVFLQPINIASPLGSLLGARIDWGGERKWKQTDNKTRCVVTSCSRQPVGTTGVKSMSNAAPSELYWCFASARYMFHANRWNDKIVLWVNRNLMVSTYNPCYNSPVILSNILARIILWHFFRNYSRKY